MLLKQLTELNGVSGNEGKVRDFIIEQIKPFADEITVDSMGSVIAFKKGTGKSSKRIGFCAHMDEVGFILSGITDDGYIKFKTVGGIDERILLSKRVKIGDNQIPGVIGIKAIHLQDPDERKKIIKQKDMYIDIGAADKESAESVVSLGDYIVFDSDYVELGGEKVKAKALDDRAGCSILIECMKKQYESDLYFCFSAQEETGLRGATIIAHRLELDAAFIVEGTTAADVPFIKESQKATSQGLGPVISFFDRSVIQDKKLNAFIIDIAKEKSIPYQHKRFGSGGNDTLAFGVCGGSCATAAISVPCRYIHSPVSVLDLSDYRNTLELIGAIAENSQKLGGIF